MKNIISVWICAFQGKFDAMKKHLDSQEVEVMEARLMKASDLNGEMDDDDDAGWLSFADDLIDAKTSVKRWV